MTEGVILVELLKVIGWLIVALVAVVAWIGKRIHDRLDDINVTLGRIDKDLTGEVANLDKRISIIERTCGMMHGDGGGQ